MRLAAYNVENLFNRARAMNLRTWEEGREVLERFSELSRLIGERDYDDGAKRRMVELMLELGLERSDTAEFVTLRQNRGGFVKRPRGGGLQVVASGRADWVGSLELTDEPIDERAMRNTAQVIRDIKADVLGVVEAENRPALAQFNALVLTAVGGEAFRHLMVIDGNDTRGIDVGLVTRAGYRICDMRSHVDDRTADGEPVFSRDCPEYEVILPSGERLWVLVNHFKSKGFGRPADSNRRRRAQAERVKAIYQELTAGGRDFVAILGDLNDTPDSAPLAPLLAETDLEDIAAHPDFDDGGYPGTYGSSGARNKIDYILLSPKLFERVRGGGIFRRGMWPGVRPRRWDAYAEIEEEVHAASDHGAIWADLDL